MGETIPFFLQCYVHNDIPSTAVSCLLTHESKMLFGVFKFSIVRHLEWFPKCITRYLFMASCAKTKI